MKRTIIFLQGTCVAASMFFLSFFSGCGNIIDEPEIQPESPALAAPSRLSQTYKKIINLELSYAQKGVDLVQEYVDLPKPETRNVLTSGLDFADIGTYLPADLSTLKRVKPGKAARSILEEVTLDQELDALAEAFSQELTLVLPDPEKALTLPFVTGTDEGIQLGDDAVIPYNSLQGAVTVEILNSIADGENIEELITNFEREITAFLDGTSENQARGLIKNGDGRWANGVINYRWGTISASHKAAVQTAMNTWATKTSGKVRFRELSNDGWDNFQLAIHAIGCISIYDVTNPNYAGKATVGYVSGDSGYLRLDAALSAPAMLARVPLHKLGHVLGLYHEHQRHDRDNWITVTNNDSNNVKIPKDIEGWRWKYLRVRLGLWTISIPYLAFWTERYSTTFRRYFNDHEAFV